MLTVPTCDDGEKIVADRDVWAKAAAGRASRAQMRSARTQACSRLRGGERRQSQRMGCALTAWETQCQATSQISCGQDRHDPRTTRNRFQPVRQDALDRSRIVEARSDRVGRVEEHVEGDGPVGEHRESKRYAAFTAAAPHTRGRKSCTTHHW
jgi:hypothetical protein